MRDYVSIAPRHKSLADRHPLIGSMLETEPATGGEMPRRVLDEMVECGERIGACRQSEQRFECQRIAFQ